MNVTGSEEAKAPESSRAGCIVHTDDGNNRQVTAGFGGKWISVSQPNFSANGGGRSNDSNKEGESHQTRWQNHGRVS